MGLNNWTTYKSGMTIDAEVVTHPLNERQSALHIFGTEGVTYLVARNMVRERGLLAGAIETEYYNDDRSGDSRGFMLCMMSGHDVRTTGSCYYFTWCTCQNTLMLYRVTGGLLHGDYHALITMRLQSFPQRFVLRFLWNMTPELFGNAVFFEAHIGKEFPMQEDNTVLLFRLQDTEDALLTSTGEAFGGIIAPHGGTRDLYFGSTVVHTVTYRKK